MEEQDATIEATALRETEEEVGIERQHVSVLGYLTTMPTITGYAVTPVVGMVSNEAVLRTDPMEVEYTFEVPLPYLMDSANDVHTQWRAKGQKSVPMIEIHWQEERIWGATAFMILALRKILLKQ